MSEEEIKHMRETVLKGVRNENDPIWKKAFLEHNDAAREAGRNTLGPSCAPCYAKVLNYFLKDEEKVPIPKFPLFKPRTIKPRPLNPNKKRWG